MEAHHHMHSHQKSRENHVGNQTEGRAEQDKEAKQVSPRSSPSSSPSHEFSFTISLHSSSSTTNPADRSKALPSNSLAVDLSPADDIFFHGHLLPLHLLSHLSSSPRFSTTSMDSLTLPIRDLLEDEKLISRESGSCGTSNRISNITLDSISSNNYAEEDNKRGTKEENKSKPGFSLFGLTKGRKGCQVSSDNNKEDKENSKQKRKMGFDVMHALKRYLRMVKPLVHFRSGRSREKIGLHGKAYSHSANLVRRNKPELRGRRGEYSAPASMRTSPTNSGLLLATTTASALPPASDSTMEELQAAIQAAIAHCKNSIAKEEKLKC